MSDRVTRMILAKIIDTLRHMLRGDREAANEKLEDARDLLLTDSAKNCQEEKHGKQG